MEFNKFEILWNFLTSEIKNEIKLCSLALLASKSQTIINGAFMLLSEMSIFYIKESMYGEFLDFVDNLFNMFCFPFNSNNKNPLVDDHLNTNSFKLISLNCFKIIIEDINLIKLDYAEKKNIGNSKEMKYFANKILQITILELSKFKDFPILIDTKFLIDNNTQQDLNSTQINDKNLFRLQYLNTLLILVEKSLILFEEVFKNHLSQMCVDQEHLKNYDYLDNKFKKFRNQNMVFNNNEYNFIRQIFFEVLGNVFHKTLSYFIHVDYKFSSNKDFAHNDNSVSQDYFSLKFLSYPFYFIDKNSIYALLDNGIKIFTKFYDLYYKYLDIKTDYEYFSSILIKLLFILDFNLNYIIKNKLKLEESENAQEKIEERIKNTTLLIFDLFITISEKELNSASFYVNEKELFYIIDKYSKNLQDLKNGKIYSLNNFDYKTNKLDICDELNKIILEYLNYFIYCDFSLSSLIDKKIVFSEILPKINYDSIIKKILSF